MFTNLEELTINGTYIEELNLNSLANLKYLHCVDNMLANLDVSNNSLLEYLNISSGGDVPPFNSFDEIDLSNNPNIHTLVAAGSMESINLKNGNNNQDMYINISANWDLPPDVVVGHTCIEVDNPEAAQSNQSPYSEWVISHSNQSYSFADDCNLGRHNVDFSQTISIYPNPASDVLNIDPQDGVVLEKVELYNISGRLVREYNDLSKGSILVNGLGKGIYILKAFTDKGNYSERIIVE